LFNGLLGDRFMVRASTYWRPWGDFVDRRFLERGFGIKQIYLFFSMNLRNLHNTQEEGKW
jgi:hypothetical protein